MRVRFTPTKMRSQSTRQRTQQRSQRGGFTLIELLVVISIIAVLASLILPGVQNARATARRIKCLNNMRNIGIALQTYATDHRGQLPPLVGGEVIQNDSGGVWGPASWSVHLLPYIEQRGLFDRLLDASLPQTLSDLASTNIPVYVCPDDPNDGSDGATSYVANAGYAILDRWNANGLLGHRTDSYLWAGVGGGAGSPENIQVTSGSGVFFPTRAKVPNSAFSLNLGPEGYRPSLSRVSSGDGLSQTIFLSENLDTPDWIPSVSNGPIPTISDSNVVGTPISGQSGNGGFLGYRLGDTAFAVAVKGSGSVVADNSSTGGYGDPSAPNPAATSLASSGQPFLASDGLDVCKINENLGTAVSGRNPRPSSLHSGTVNVVFGDGSASNISNSIDNTVYLRLVSSNGNRYGQAILSGSDY